MTNDCPYNVDDLLSRIARDDEKAFVALVNWFTPKVYGHILTYIKNSHRAEELTQDIFVKIWSNRHHLPQIENFQAYLFTMVRNITISAFRQKMISWEEAPKDELESSALSPAGELEYRQLSDLLMKGIDRLPQRRKQVFCMSRLEGKSHEEIARALNVSKSAVNQHIVEALLFLRAYLGNRMISATGCLLLFLNATK